MCVVIRSVVVVMTTAHFPSQKREMPFWSLCAFSLTSAIESGHPAGASGVSPIFLFYFFFVHFWVVCVWGGGCFTRFTLIFFSPRRAIQCNSNHFRFLSFFCVPFGLVASGKEEDVDGTCHLVSTFFSISLESQGNFIIPSSSSNE